jgi:cytidylate kinase
MPVKRLIPSVDRRLSAWVSLQSRLSERKHRDRRLTITISRQFGCEGYPLAESLQEQLAVKTGETWAVFDKALIERVSRETDLSEQLLGNLGDTSRSLDKLASVIPGWRTHDEAYEILARYMVHIAEEGNAIVVGRGGAIVTQHLPNCFHFRLEAPYEHRVQSIQQRLGVTQDEAERLVLEHQKGRERFLEQFLHCSVSDPRFYHAVFNTSKNTVERITRSILELLPIERSAAAEQR